MSRSPSFADAAEQLFSSSVERPDDEEPSLADEFIATTYHHNSINMLGSNKKLLTEIMLRYRTDMRQAHRFVLDDQFTEMATAMATVPAEKTLARLQYATLPYDTTWLEFNLHAKMRMLTRLHGTQPPDLSVVSPRLGILLQRVNDTDAVCTLVSATGDDTQPMPHLTCYFFSTTETRFTAPRFGCKPMLLDRYSDEKMDVTKATMWGYTSKDPKLIANPYKPKHNDLIVPSFLSGHGDVGSSRMFPLFLKVFAGAPDDQQDRVARLMGSELHEFTGTMRWVVTVLAMMNEVPISTIPISRDRYLRNTPIKKSRYLDYHKVTLRLPKRNPVAYFERKLHESEIRRRRAHEVRAHWRTYLPEPHCGYEQHDWVYDNENGYRLCGRCNAYARLIHEHIRGDAELGWVRKDYRIKPA